MIAKTDDRVVGERHQPDLDDGKRRQAGNPRGSVGDFEPTLRIGSIRPGRRR